MADRAEGCYVWDVSGKKYLDFTSGIGVTSTGHCHPKVVAAIQAQAGRLIFAQQNILPATVALAELTDRLKRIAPSTLSKFFFCNSGSEAVDNALKVARSYTGRQNIIAFTGGYHGRTYGAMSVTTSKTVYRQFFGPMPPGVFVAPYPYCLHCPTRAAAGGLGMGMAPNVPPVGQAYEDRQCCMSPLEDLRMMLKMQTSPAVSCSCEWGHGSLPHYSIPNVLTTMPCNSVQETAAILIEPVLGEGGFLVPPPGFLSALRTLCDEHGILLIFDEVQAGMGRTGTWWSHQQLTNAQPDILIFAKGIASGFPFAGLATKPHLYERMTPGMMGGTYGSNPIGCAAAVATIDAIEEEGILENVKQRGLQLMHGLVEMSEELPIAEVRGRGLMVAAELKGPVGVASNITKLAAEKGVLLITSGARETVRFLPPLVVTEEQVNEALVVFKWALGEASK